MLNIASEIAKSQVSSNILILKGKTKLLRNHNQIENICYIVNQFITIMRTTMYILIICSISRILYSCEKDTIETPFALQKLEMTKYYDAEIFAQNDLKIYGKWEIFDISGGIHGGGQELNFDFLEIKEYGIYGFIRNDSLLEYGQIIPALQNNDELGLKVELVKDEDSNSFFLDREKYVEFGGNDTLNLISPCCDRYNYHFERVK